jgi:hypothetical protein
MSGSGQVTRLSLNRKSSLEAATVPAFAMDSFVSRENIKRYRKCASESTDTTQRSRIMSLLAEEEDKLKLELSEGAMPV